MNTKTKTLGLAFVVAFLFACGGGGGGNVMQSDITSIDAISNAISSSATTSAVIATAM